MAELNQPGKVISIWITRKGEWVFADLNHFSLGEHYASHTEWVQPSRLVAHASRCSVKEQRVDGILQSSIG